MAPKCTLSKREAHRSLDKLSSVASAFTNAGKTPLTPKCIHDLRVACRRERAFLSEFEDTLSTSQVRRARKRLKRAGRRLGEARELDVSIGLMQVRQMPNPAARDWVIRQLEVCRAVAQQEVEEIRAGIEVCGIAALESLREDVEPSAACHLRHARGRLWKGLGKLVALYRVWWTSQLDEDLHQLRVRLKTFRYAVEIYRGLYGKDGESFLKTLETAQDSLGQWNDLRCLHGRVEGLAADASQELRGSVRGMAASIGAEAEAQRHRVREELNALFEKRAVKEYRELFGDWSRECCRGAR